MPETVPAEDISVTFAGLTLRYRLWGDTQKPLLVLQHGARDHARSWDFVVAALIDDYCIAAPDLRGHGDSDHVPGGGYGDLEMVADFGMILADLEARGFSAPFRIIGHSRGGNIAVHYAAAFPERIAALVNVEGVGTPPAVYERTMAEPAGERWRRSAERLITRAADGPRVFKSPELAVRRMKQLHSKVPAEIVDHVALHAIREVEGGFSWKYDSLMGFGTHRPESPAEYGDLYKSITCPVLMIYGTESFSTPPSMDGRGQMFPSERLEIYEGAGHWLHHDMLDRFIGDVRAFLDAN